MALAARHVSSREKEGRKSEGCTRVSEGGGRQETHCSAVFAIEQMTNRTSHLFKDDATDDDGRKREMDGWMGARVGLFYEWVN